MPPKDPSFGRMLRRAVMLRCPWCGSRRTFVRRWFGKYDRCRTCPGRKRRGVRTQRRHDQHGAAFLVLTVAMTIGYHDVTRIVTPMILRCGRCDFMPIVIYRSRSRSGWHFRRPSIVPMPSLLKLRRRYAVMLDPTTVRSYTAVVRKGNRVTPLPYGGRQAIGVVQLGLHARKTPLHQAERRTTVSNVAALDVALAAVDKRSQIITDRQKPQWVSSINRALSLVSPSALAVVAWSNLRSRNPQEIHIAMHVVAEAQRNGICAYIDAEHAMDPVYTSAMASTSISCSSASQTPASSARDRRHVGAFGTVDVVVIDSVAHSRLAAEIEGEMGDTHVGLQARLMSRALPNSPTSAAPTPSPSSSTS